MVRDGVRRDGRVAPRKILVVEIDCREIVRLEIADPGTRLGTDNLARVDPGYVARTDKLHCDGRYGRAVVL